MSKLCTQCRYLKRQQNSEYLCSREALATSLVNGQSTYFTCEAERSIQGKCGIDAIHFSSLDEYHEKLRLEDDAKRKAYVDGLSSWKRFLYKFMLT